MFLMSKQDRDNSNKSHRFRFRSFSILWTIFVAVSPAYASYLSFIEFYF